jgi:hypothetical protein
MQKLETDMGSVMSSPLLRALQRGIGVHHSSLPKQYRQVRLERKEKDNYAGS